MGCGQGMYSLPRSGSPTRPGFGVLTAKLKNHPRPRWALLYFPRLLAHQQALMRCAPWDWFRVERTNCWD